MRDVSKCKGEAVKYPNNDDRDYYLHRRHREIELILLLIPVIIVGTIFLKVIGQYALVGMHPFQFFADSNTYHDIYSGVIPSPDGFVGISYNFLGPLLILSATGGSIYLVMIANIIMFGVSMIFICRALDIDPVKASIIQFLSPLTASSLLSVNKEIIVFPVIALLIAGFRYKSVPLVVAAVLVSVMARWQLTVFCVALIGLFFVRGANRYLVLSASLVSISIVYYFSEGLLRPVLEHAEISISSYTEGSGFFERLLDMQKDGLYALVAPIKAAHLLFSMGLHLDAIINPIVIYNDQIIGAYCLVNLIFFVFLVFKRRFMLRNDLIMISVVYLVIFALTPVYAPRYFYAVTILWALVLAGASGSIERRKVAPDYANVDS